MKRVTYRSVLLGLLVAAWAASAQKETSAAEATKELRAVLPDGRLLKIGPYRSAVSALGGKPCEPDSQTTCEINVLPLEVQNGKPKYCLVVAPEVKVKTVLDGDRKPKTVVWQLKQDELDGKPVAFHEYAGIVIIADHGDQVDRKNSGLGDGSGAIRADRYYVKTKRNKNKAESTYLPVVLWGKKGEEELCAAIDPKIVNF